jgi:hypothetical protein
VASDCTMVDEGRGTGVPASSLSTGPLEEALGTGVPASSLSTGPLEEALGTGVPVGSIATGPLEEALGTGVPEDSLVGLVGVVTVAAPEALPAVAVVLIWVPTSSSLLPKLALSLHATTSDTG